MFYNTKGVVGLLFCLWCISCSKSGTESLREAKKMSSDSIQLSHEVPTNVMIDIDDSGLGPCEPTICINPNNPNHIVAGSILDRLHISKDGGKTWVSDTLTSSFGVYGDPVIRIGPNGTIYYSHLSNPKGRAYASEEFLDRIVVQKSIDAGRTFTDGTAPNNERSKDQDKQWLYVDPAQGTVLMSWTEFDKYGSKSSSDKSRILFSKSDDRGESWSGPISISDKEGDCIDDDNTTEGAVPVMDKDGNIFVTWAFNDKIYLDKSTDGGASWLEEDLIVADQFGGWALDIPGINRCNGMPILSIDRSGGPHDGNMYINWSDQKNGSDDTDIWLKRSIDGGKSWSERIKVNDDGPGKHQFFSWMDVDPKTGHIYIVFYDRRNHEGNETDVYLAYSTDGGKTFKNKLISEEPFIPIAGVFFGDYNDISAYDGQVRPIWTRFERGSLSVWTALIDIE